MKKLFVIALVATMMASCDKSELKDAEETLFELREEKKQDEKFKLFNSHIVGVKNDAPQGKSNENKQQQQNQSSNSNSSQQ